MAVFAETAISNDWIEGYIDLGDAKYQLGEIDAALISYKMGLAKGYKSLELEEKIDRIEISIQEN